MQKKEVTRDEYLLMIREHPRYRTPGRGKKETVPPAPSMGPDRGLGAGQRQIGKHGKQYSVPFGEFELFVSPQGDLKACPVRSNRLDPYNRSQENVDAGADIGSIRDLRVQALIDKGFLWVDQPGAPPDWFEKCADEAMARRAKQKELRANARKTTDPHLKQAAASGAIISQVIVDALKEQLRGESKTKAVSGQAPRNP
jgi:hypothetical protein